VSDLVETSDDSKDAKIRILICKTCTSIQPLPDFEGNPDHDETLHARVAEHQYPGSRPTRGHDMELGRVSETSWNNPEKRKSMLAEIGKHVKLGDGGGLGVELYDVKDNFMEDAMKCWRFKHGRTANCDDYKHDKMKLLPDSRAERKDLGLDPAQRPVQYLCQYCPVESIVQQRKNKAKGLYK
jgi:hypothetical protein